MDGAHARRAMARTAGFLLLVLVLGGLSIDASAVEPEPIDPSNGEEALLDAAESIPIKEIDKALGKFPVPYVIVASAGSGPAVKTTNRAGAPTKVDVDGSKSTGKGGSDIEVLVTAQVPPNAGVTLTVTRLGSAPFVQDVRVLVAVPFAAFTSEVLPARPNLFLGFETRTAGAAPGGRVPEKQVVTFKPGTLGGTSHVLDLDTATTGAANPLLFLAGHFDGTAGTGVLNMSGWATYAEPVPATIDTTLTVGESAAADPLASTAALRWIASATTNAAVSYLESETHPDATPDFRTQLSVPTLPSHVNLAVGVDEADGTFGVGMESTSAPGTVQLLHEREDGLVVDLDATDVPDDISLDGVLAGGADLTVSDPTVDLDFELLSDAGFDETDAVTGRAVRRIALDATDAPTMSLAFGVDDGPTFALSTDGGTVPELTFTAGDAANPVLPSGFGAGHSFSLLDRGDDATAAVHLVDVSAADLALDAGATSETLTLDTTSPAPLLVSVDADSASVFAPGSDVDVRCDVVAMSPDTATFATNFYSSFAYASEPPSGLDSIDCAGAIGTFEFEIGFADIPGSFAFEFDPDGSLHVLLGEEPGELSAASVEPEPRLGHLAMRLSDANGLPGSGALFGEPLQDARLQLDDLPSTDAGWSDGDSGTSVDADTAGEGTTFGGLQVAVSTVVGLDELLDAETAPEQHIASDDELGALSFGLFDADAVALGHDAATGSTDLDGVTAGGRPMTYDLHADYNGVALDASCVVDPMPAGGLTLTTDYAGGYTLATDPPVRVDEVVCEGATGDVEFDVTIDDLPPQVTVEIDPASGVSFQPVDPTAEDRDVIGAVNLSVHAPDGIPGTDGLFSDEPVRQAVLRVTEIPAVTGTWSRDGNDFDVDLGADDDGQVIPDIQLAISPSSDPITIDATPADPYIKIDDGNTGLAAAAFSGGDASLTTKAILGPGATVQGLLAALLGVDRITLTFNTATGVTTMVVQEDEPRPLTVGLGGFGFPGGASCTFDQLPAGTTTLNTNFVSTYQVNTAPRQAIDAITCAGAVPPQNFQAAFTGMPGFLKLQSFADGVSTEVESDVGVEATVEQVDLEVFADDGFVLPGSTFVFPGGLAETGLRLDVAPSLDGVWSVGPATAQTPSVSIHTVEVLGVPTPVGGIQVTAASEHEAGGLPVDPAPGIPHELRMDQPPAPPPGEDPELNRILLRFFDLTDIDVVTTVVEGEPPAEGEDPTQIVTYDAAMRATTARPFELGLHGVFAPTPLEKIEVDAELAINDVPTELELTTDLTKLLRYTANDAIDEISLDGSAQKLAPAASAEEHPTTIDLDLDGLPAEIAITVDLTKDKERALVLSGDKVNSAPEELGDDPIENGGIDHLLLDVRSAGGVFGTANKWVKVELDDVPPVVDVHRSTVNDDTEIVVAGRADATLFNLLPEPIGTVEVVLSADAFPLALVNRLPFAELDESGCLVNRSTFATALDDQAYSDAVNDHLDDMHCDTFALESGDDHVLLRSEMVQPAEGDPAETVVHTQVLLHGVTTVAVDTTKAPEDADALDLPEASVTIKTDDDVDAPFFFGQHRLLGGEVGDLMTVARVDDVPASIELDVVPAGEVHLDSSAGVGRVDVYTGPRFGADPGDSAVRVAIPDAPADVDAEFQSLKNLAGLDFAVETLEDLLALVGTLAPIGVPEASFDASADFELQLIFQAAPKDTSPGSRTRLDLELEDADLGPTFDGPGYSPCDELFGFNTCFGLVRVAELLDFDEPVTGFILHEPLNDDPLPLATAEEPGDVEFTPLVTLMLEDLETAVIGVELQFDPKQILPPVPFIDLELLSVDVVGDWQLGLWDPGWGAICLSLPPEPPEEGEDPPPAVPICLDTSKPPSYVTASPWLFGSLTAASPFE